MSELNTYTVRRVLMAVSNLGLDEFYNRVDRLIQADPSMTYIDALKQAVTEATTSKEID